MGVNLKKVNINLEFVSERVIRLSMIILVSANLEMCLDSMQRCIVQLLLKACQHCLVLADVVDDWHHHSEGVLPWLQGNIGPGELEEDEDLLLVSNDAGLAHRKDVGSNGRHCQA